MLSRILGALAVLLAVAAAPAAAQDKARVATVTVHSRGDRGQSRRQQRRPHRLCRDPAGL